MNIKMQIGLMVVLMPLGFAQDRLTDKVIVDLPQAVQMNGRTVPAGHYELRQLNNAAGGSHVMFVTTDGAKHFEAAVTTIPALANNTPDETKVILWRVGNNYYVDKVWVAGKDYGYEFELPAEAKSFLKENRSSTATLVSSYKAPEAPRPETTVAAAPPPPPPAPEQPKPAPQTEIAQNQPPPPQAAPAPTEQPPPPPAQSNAQPQAPAQPEAPTLPRTASNTGNWLLFAMVCLGCAAYFGFIRRAAQ